MPSTLPLALVIAQFHGLETPKPAFAAPTSSLGPAFSPVPRQLRGRLSAFQTPPLTPRWASPAPATRRPFPCVWQRLCFQSALSEHPLCDPHTLPGSGESTGEPRAQYRPQRARAGIGLTAARVCSVVLSASSGQKKTQEHKTTLASAHCTPGPSSPRSHLSPLVSCIRLVGFPAHPHPGSLGTGTRYT